MPRPRWAIRTAQVAAVCVALAIVLALVVHAPPVRRAALDRVVALLAERFDVALRADALDYNLLRLRASLINVEVAATGSVQSPFLTADRVQIDIPTSALFGAFSIDRLALGNARISVLRRADGSTNLPRPAPEGEPGEPAAVPIGRLQILQLAVTVSDETQGLRVDLPALAVDVGATEGTVRSNRPGRVERAGVATDITSLGGGVTFDGRSVRVTRFGIATPEATAQADGVLALLFEEPRVDVRLSARADLAALRRLAPDMPPFSGPLTVEGTVEGLMAQPNLTAQVRGDSLAWEDLVLSNVRAALAIDSQTLRVTELSADTSGGRIAGRGDLEFAAEQADLTLSWSDIDLDALGRALGSPAPRPSARATGSARLRGAGADVRNWAIDARTRLDPGARARGRVAVSGDAILRAAAGRWSLDASGQVERAPVRAAMGGLLDGGALTSSTVAGTVTIAGAEIPAVLGSLRDAGLLDVPRDAITAGRIDASAALAGTLARPRLDLTATATGVAAEGVSDVQAELTASGTLEELTVNARVQQATNVATAVGTVWPGDRRVDARITGTLRDPRALLPDVPIAGTADVDLQVQGPFTGIGANGTVAIANASYSGIDLGALSATVRADANVAHVEVVSRELSASAQAEVTLTASRLATVAVQIDGASLERLTRDLDTPAPVRGSLSLRARGTAPLDDWRRGTAEVDLTSVDAQVGELPLRLASPARVTYAGETIDVARLEADLGRTRVSVNGRIAARDSAPAVADGLRAQLVGDVAHVIEAVRAAGLIEQIDVDARGPLALLARVTGSLERPVVAADFDLANAEVAVRDLPPIRIRDVRATVANGWLERATVAGEWQGARFEADARAPLRVFRAHLPAALVDTLPATGEPGTLNTRITSITPAVLAPFVDAETLAQVGGVVDASMRIEATSLEPADLRGEVRLDRLELDVAGLPVRQREPTRVAIEGGLARVASWQWAGDGATLDVQGQIGLADQRAALLAAGRLDLRLLAPFVRSAGLTLAGTLAPRLSVTGSLTDPQFDGVAVIAGAELRLRDPRVIATGVDAFAVLTPTQVRITSLSGVVNGGTLAGSGELSYGQGNLPAGQLRATVARMGLELPDGLRSELDADLTLGIEERDDEAAARVTGTVTIVRSAYRQPLAVVAGLFTGLRAERLAAAQAAPDSAASRVALDVRLVTENDVIVDNNLARLQLGGDLRVIGTAAAPSLAGRAVLRDGGQLFLGNNVYTIESGTADFADPVAIVPDLNVRATTRAGGHEIQLDIRGTPDDLEVELESLTDPDLAQADVASLLLTGRVLEDVAGAEGQIVREQVLGYLSGDILGIAGRTLGLDTLRLGGPDVSTVRRDTAAAATAVDPTSRLTFGKTIRDDIELTYSQSLRDGDAQTWIVDYRPLAQVNVRFVADDDNLGSLEFRHDLSVGGGSAARRAATRPPPAKIQVVDVTIAGDTGGPDARLRELLRLGPGDTFDFAEWQSDRDRLEALLHREDRLEARVTAQRVDQGGGVVLAYDIAAGPLTSIAVTGYSPSPVVRQRLEDAWSESVFDEFLREEAEAIVRAALVEDGYLEPRIVTALERGETEVLRIVVEPDLRVPDRRVAVAAGDEGLRRDLEAWIARNVPDAAWGAPEVLQDALAAELRARGYLAARVVAGPPRVEGRTAVRPVTVDAGAMFLIGDIRFNGAMVIADERLRAAAALMPGATYRPADLDLARRRIDATYRDEGFTRTRVVAGTNVDAAAHRVAIEFAIDEGPRQVLREVMVHGNRGASTDVIVRTLGVTVGSPLAADAWLQARARLFDTGLFRRVDVTVEPIEETPADGTLATRLVATVEEWPALRIRYGLQLSEERPEDSFEGRDLVPGLSADLTRQTLFGRAISVGAVFEYQRRERLVRGFLSAPTLFGRPVESVFSAERSHRQFAGDDVVSDVTGVAWEQRVRGGPLQFSYSYRFDRDHTFETGPDDPTDPLFDLTVNIARLTGSAVFDSRDDPTDTRRGWLLSSTSELSETALGSDLSFVRELAQAYYFRPWRRLVFASAGRFGIINPLAGQTVIPSELFFAGGPRTVRGVEEDGLGPRDFFGDPTGGRVMLVMNQEVRFPIYRWLRGVGFFDAGNVFAEPGSVDLGRLVTSVGGGLRLDTPFALLRLDYGRPWTNANDVRPSRWTFGIGQSF